MTPIDGLKRTLDEAEWSWLKPHHERGALIWIDSELDLLTVGVAIAQDSKSDVESWLKQGLLGQPTDEQILKWEQHPQLKFKIVIVQPFVLAQEPQN